MYSVFTEFLQGKNKICVIQAENPDGDSLGSAIALDYLLSDKEITLYCPVDIPKYLHYFGDWSRITNEFDYKADGYIIVDTAAEVLLSKLLDDSAIKNRLYNAPVLVIDHHETPDDIKFPHDSIIELAPACTEVIFKIAKEQNIPHQLEIFCGIGTDAGEMHKEKAGVPTSVLSIPSRYAHCPVEIIDLGDLNATADLLAAFITAMRTKEEFSFLSDL